MPLTLIATALVAGGAAALAAPLSPADARMSVVYEMQQPARAIFTSPRALTPARGGYRQAPGPGGTFARDDQGQYSLGKIEDHVLLSMGTEGMAAAIRSAIDATPSGLVAIDEIGNRWRDPRVPQTYKWVAVRGKRIRVASHNDVVATKRGYRVIRHAQVPPMPDATHPAVRLSDAMAILAATPYPGGGTYAQRVHLYVAPAMVTTIGEGRGEHFTLDRSGSRSVRPAWRGVIRALALSGGVWLEMYHGRGDTLNARVWRNVPGRFADYLVRNGGTGIPQVHFLITATGAAPAGAPPDCGSPMACQFAAARATPAGAAVLDNGPGAYRTESQAADWLAQYNRVFPD